MKRYVYRFPYNNLPTKYKICCLDRQAFRGYFNNISKLTHYLNKNISKERIIVNLVNVKSVGNLNQRLFKRVEFNKSVIWDQLKLQRGFLVNFTARVYKLTKVGNWEKGPNTLFEIHYPTRISSLGKKSLEKCLPIVKDKTIRFNRGELLRKLIKSQEEDLKKNFQFDVLWKSHWKS